MTVPAPRGGPPQPPDRHSAPGAAQPRGRPDRSSAPATGRDRDTAGRPRNARPRDDLGRPLPRGVAGTERVPDDLSLPPAESLALAQQLLDEGHPFHAHEVLEASWKQAPSAERDLWRGLAQVAVGLTHVQRGNGRGAVALLRRAALRVGEYAAAPPHGIDAAGIAEACTRLADWIEAAGPAALTGPDLHIKLTR
jgi:uncharacterized protein